MALKSDADSLKETPMIPTIKAGLLATTMAAVALIPAAGIVTLASVDFAFAKGGGNGNGSNGGGGERGNGNGGQASEARGGGSEARGGGRPEWAGSRGDGGNRSGGRSESVRHGGDPISNFIRSLTGEEKREVRAQPRAEPRAARQAPTAHAPQASISPGKRPARNSDLHPSELGNMNGALNANINAVLAHVRNGNFEGPVGSLAALAVADAALAAAERTVNEGALADLLGIYGYASVQNYYDELEADPTMSRHADLDAAIAALGSNPELGEPYAFTPPTEDEIADATAALPELLVAQGVAEEGLLSLWNKNTDANPDEFTPEESALLDDLRTRLAGYETDIGQAMTEAETRAASVVADSDEQAACADEDSCEDLQTIEEDLAAID
jgi:hypothetical protein